MKHRSVNKGDILQVKIVLLDVDPPIWRRVLVPASLTLRRLHETVQAAMGWLDQHLYEFQIGDRRYGTLDPEYNPMGSTVANDRAVKLSTLVEKGIDRLYYTYDFGDDWRHEIIIEDIRAGESDVDYPVLVEGAGHCPPEDCGGAPGFQAFLEAITNPAHPDHEDALDWYGDSYDPEDIEREVLDAQLSRIARSRRGGLKARGRPHKNA
jgi:hypothetical protein